MRGFKLSIMLLGGLLMITAVIINISHTKPVPITRAASPGNSIQFLPIIKNGDPLNCRFGINAIEAFGNLRMDDLEIGWYVDYGAKVAPEKPNSASYAPTIRLTQTGPNAGDYTYSPTGTALMDAIAGNPKADWLIGNEPDRRDFQDDIEPHVYAAAYHELYTLIKAVDPTARIFAGTIVQPTPIRLQYLDMILTSYAQQQGGLPLPADGWSIHNFILNEVSCDHNPDNCWGAEIPPGINVPFGEIVAIDDNDNIDIFQDRIVAFRQWMFDHDYGDLPLVISEYGVLMPDWLGFPESRVNAFMDASVNYMLTATDPVLGDPHDNYRLVQGWSWYSTGAPTDPFNGRLFDGNSTPRPLSGMGQNYAELLDQENPEVDYYPTALLSETLSISNSVTITLQTTVANGGNTAIKTRPVTVRFYNGDPALGGAQIGNDQVMSLSGCGHQQTATVTWLDVLPGTYDVFVETDANQSVSESNEENNLVSIEVVVPTIMSSQ